MGNCLKNNFLDSEAFIEMVWMNFPSLSSLIAMPSIESRVRGRGALIKHMLPLTESELTSIFGGSNGTSFSDGTADFYYPSG